MKLLQRYLLGNFIPVLFVSLLFFVLLLEMGELFANLWKYLSNDAPLSGILRVLWLYVPKCVSFSMPMAILFASSFTMGNLYARNELTAIFASGFSLYALVVPLLVAGLFLSIGMFFFEDRVVIHSTYQKNALNRLLLKQEESLSNTNIVVLSESGTVVYTADYYLDTEKKLFSFLAVIRDGDGRIGSIIIAPAASWDGTRWLPENPVVYAFSEGGGVLVSRSPPSAPLAEPPGTFRRNTTSVDELSSADAKKFIDSMRKAGLPYSEQLSNYYRRFSFPLTIFIVLFFSISLGGRFRKNIMLMSLLLSLSIAVLYYVLQMVTMLFAKWEYISPLAGAWFPVILFIGASSLILRSART